MPGRRKRASAADVMEYLGPIYGPVEWEPRYNPAEELVYTILSQHTSDVNSERAFGNLMSRFEDLDAIADASTRRDRGGDQVRADSRSRNRPGSKRC